MSASEVDANGVEKEQVSALDGRAPDLAGSCREILNVEYRCNIVTPEQSRLQTSATTSAHMPSSTTRYCPVLRYAKL